MRKSTIALCCLALLVGGCGGANKPMTPDQQKEGTLSQVGGMVLAYQLSKNKPPEKFADLASVKAVSGNGYDAVKNGDIILRYGAALTDTTEEPGNSPSDEVLAYGKEVPESGGQVLMLNRKVETMSADKFKAAKKAGKG